MKSICLALLLALSTTTACSHYNSPRRQERAYAKYIKKMRADRDRRLARLRRDLERQTQAESEPREKTQMSEAPQTVPRDSDNQ
jgi:hypothetical protein